MSPLSFIRRFIRIRFRLLRTPHGCSDAEERHQISPLVFRCGSRVLRARLPDWLSASNACIGYAATIPARLSEFVRQYPEILKGVMPKQPEAHLHSENASRQQIQLGSFATVL